MRAARFRVSSELVEKALNMPPGSRIIGASFDFQGLWVEFVADDPSLPEAEEPHPADPIIKQHRFEWDWNVR